MEKLEKLNEMGSDTILKLIVPEPPKKKVGPGGVQEYP